MTESEWDTCNDPEAMLSFLEGGRPVRDRKFRLFCCACFRRVWYALTDERARKAIEVAEQYADGLADELDREQAWREACRSSLLGGMDVAAALWVDARPTAVLAVGAAARAAHSLRGGPCDLLRDIFNPFQPTYTFLPSLLSWKDGLVVNLARAAYEERSLPEGVLDQAQLAVLADALEESGCDNQDVLTHLRVPGPHVRGCFVLDLLLQKE